MLQMKVDIQTQGQTDVKTNQQRYDRIKTAKERKKERQKERKKERRKEGNFMIQQLNNRKTKKKLTFFHGYKETKNCVDKKGDREIVQRKIISLSYLFFPPTFFSTEVFALFAPLPHSPLPPKPRVKIVSDVM